MVSCWGSEAGPYSRGREEGRKGLGILGPERRRGLLGLRKEAPGSPDSWAPPWLHLARSFLGDYPCSSTSPRGQVQVQCELGREEPEPLSLVPHPHLSLRGSRPNPRALPAAPSAAQSTSALGALRGAATPIPGWPPSDPFSMSWPPLSAPPSPFCGTLSLQDFQPASPPYRESGSPNTEAAGD